MSVRILLRLGALALLGLAVGCSSDDGAGDGGGSGGPVISSFSVSPSVVDHGESATLSWKTRGASEVIITNRATDDVILHAVTEPSGTLQVTPDITTTYVLRAIDGEVEVKEEAAVEVRPAIVQFTTAAGDGPAVIGNPLVVEWKTVAAQEVILTNDEGYEFTVTGARALQGWVEAPVTETGTFTLVARSGDLEVSETITVDAIHMDPPTIASFEAETLFVPAGEETPVEVSWIVEGASELRLFVNNEAHDLQGASLEEDSVTLTVKETVQLALVARNLAGETEARLTIEAEALPTIASFLAYPARLPLGGSTTLEWATEGAAAVELEEDGVLVELDEPTPTGSVEIETIAADTVFVLRAFNRAGAFVEEAIEVGIGAPQIVAFDSARLNHAGSAPVDLEWEVLGGTQLTVLDPDQMPIDSCITADPREIRQGGCQFTSPDSLGSYVYTLVVRDSLGDEVQAEAVIHVVDGPTIDSFVASAERIEPGEPVTLSWRTNSDPNGLIPALSLTDDRGGSYSVAEKDAIEDSIEIIPGDTGNYVFTLKASTPGTTPAEATVSVLVEASATIVLSAPEVFDPATAESFDLGWSQTNAVVVTIWELDEEGQPIDPPLLHIEDPDPSGSIPVDPASTVTYFAVAENETGYPTETEITVQVIGPEILSFEATPEDLLLYGFTTLTWTTANATSVTLDPPYAYSIRPGTEDYIKVSERPTSTQLEHEGNTCGGSGTPGCPLLVFPEGFTFTYNGHTYDRANVFMSGLISFDLNRDNSTTPPSNTNQRLPVNAGGGENPTGWTEIIAPYWGGLNYPAGAGIHYELITDHPRGKFLAIEWHGITQGVGRTVCSSPLGVNLILWEDGGFDFRYDQPNTSVLNPADQLCNGSGASIGFQHDMGEVGVQISYGMAHEGGIANKSWSMFPATLGASGLVEVLVPDTVIFTLTADGIRGRSVSQELTVRAHEPPNFIMLVSEPPTTKGKEGEEPGIIEVGEWAAIEWRGLNVVSVVVEDPDGKVVCQSTPLQIPDGGCGFTVTTPGVQTYQVIGEDFMGNTVTRPITFDVRQPLRLTSLAVNPAELRMNALEPITLSWEAQGAASVRILLDGAEVPDLGSPDPNDGSVQLSPTRTTTYVLELADALGRILETEVLVPVRSFEDGTIGATKIVADGNEPVTISWDVPLLTSGRPMVTLEQESFEMFEVADSPFVDISTDGTEIEGVKRSGTAAASNNVKVEFPEGFTFPFFDEVVDGVYPATTGYVSLRSGSASQNIQPMLYWTLNFEHVHIAPFNEWLRSHDIGTIYYKFFEHPTDADLDHMVIQWHRMQLTNTVPTSPEEEDNLTFQLALYRDGSMEFRYGTMVSSRFPDRAGGNGAVAGFHEPFFPAAYLDEHYTPPWRGYELFFKPANPINLNGRTWRYQARKATDSYTFTPTETREYKVCFSLEGFRECKSVTVVVPAAGDLMITELFLDPEDGQAAQWFEIRNTTPHEIDLRGFTLANNTGSVVISGDDPILIGPGEYKVLAASPNPALNPDYVYGTDFALGPAEDTLIIRYKDREVARATWDESWSIPRGRSLSLDPRWHKPHALSNDDPSRWCDGGTGIPNTVKVSCSSAHYNANHFASNYSFIDISKIGNRIGILSNIGRTNQETFAIPGGVGFPFPFFGVLVNDVWVSTNGFLGLSGARDPLPVAEPLPRPGSGSPGIIAPLWTPLEGTGEVYYLKTTINGRQVLIVQWHKAVRNIGHTQNNYPGHTTFQAQLWNNGDIVLAYDEMYAIYFPVAGDPNPQQEHFGGVGTVGIESIGGNEGFMYLHQEPILRKGQTIVYINKSGQGGR